MRILQKVNHLCLNGYIFCIAQWIVDCNGLLQDVPDAHLGIEGHIQVLKYHLHVFPEWAELI